MKIHIKICQCYCATEEFSINGIPAEDSDFGEKEDKNPENAPPWGCGNMTFTPKPFTQAVLDKYGISVDEYKEIAEELASNLSFGTCAWCA